MRLGEHDPTDRARGPDWAREVLHFWFSELEERDWWAKSPALDERIRTRFAALHERLAGVGAGEVHGSEAILAAVIVLDQFSRNLFRGSALAFAADPVARRLARDAIAAGYDRAMQPAERLFLYMPFEHSEDLADQQRSVELIASIGRDDWTRFADAHKAIIDRFGRFPHRNVALGRASTPEEIAAMQEPMGSF
jgi:uncharacterized protein (DUF924 family)